MNTTDVNTQKHLKFMEAHGSVTFKMSGNHPWSFQRQELKIVGDAVSRIGLTQLVSEVHAHATGFLQQTLQPA